MKHTLQLIASAVVRCTPAFGLFCTTSVTDINSANGNLILYRVAVPE